MEFELTSWLERGLQENKVKFALLAHSSFHTAPVMAEVWN
jgi:hypothetical protein